MTALAGRGIARATKCNGTGAACADLENPELSGRNSAIRNAPIAIVARTERRSRDVEASLSGWVLSGGFVRRLMTKPCLGRPATGLDLDAW
jgi:hypothetical protein